MAFPTLVEQIQQLRHKSYTRYEIDRDLINLGFDPNAIEEAWQKINFPAQSVKTNFDLRFWLIFGSYLAGFTALCFLLLLWLNNFSVALLIAILLWIIGAICAKFIERWHKVFSRAMLYATVVIGCYVYGTLAFNLIFIGLINALVTLSKCKGGCYP